MVAEINRIVPQLFDGLSAERDKLNFLPEVVTNHQWADVSVLQAQAQKLAFPMCVVSSIIAVNYIRRECPIVLRHTLDNTSQTRRCSEV